MKKVFYLLVAILAVAACSKEPMNTEVVDENPVAAGKTMTLKATLEETRGEMGSDGKYSWSSGDEIAVEFVDGQNQSTFLKFKTTAGDGVFTHTFTSEEEGLTLGTRAFSPASIKEQAGLGADEFYLGQSYANGLVPLYANVENDELSFKHLFAMMEVTFNNVPSSMSNPDFGVSYNQDWGTFTVGGSSEEPVATVASANSGVISLTGVAVNNGAATIKFPVLPGNNAVQVMIRDANQVNVFSKQASSKAYSRKTLYRMPVLSLGTFIKITNNAYAEMTSVNKHWDTFSEGKVDVIGLGTMATIEQGAYIYQGVQSGSYAITIRSSQNANLSFTRTLQIADAPGTVADYTFTFGEGLKTADEHFFYAVDQDGGMGASIYGWDADKHALYGSFGQEVFPTATTTMWENGRSIRMFDMANLHGYIFLKGKHFVEGVKLTGDVLVNDDDRARGWIAWGFWHNNNQEGCYQRTDWTTYIREDVWK